jgi:hypothetical protein
VHVNIIIYTNTKLIIIKAKKARPKPNFILLKIALYKIIKVT